MSHKIQVRRGLQSDLPLLDEGEIGFSLDQKRTYIGSPSGNVELAKASELADIAINVKTFGAVGDGTTDDTAAIQAAANYAKSIQAGILFPEQSKFKITDTIDLLFIRDVQIKGEIWSFVDNKPAIIVGATSTNTRQVNIFINWVEKKNTLNPTDIAVRVQGIKNANVHVNRAYYLQVYANEAVVAAASVSYSKFILGTIEQVELFGETSYSWITECQFYGGRIQNELRIGNPGSYAHNQNVFYKPCFEGAKLTVINGRRNMFYDARTEGSAQIRFDEGAALNVVYDNFISNDREIYGQAVVTDNGLGNIVLTNIERSLYKLPMVYVDYNTDVRRLNMVNTTAIDKDTTNKTINVYSFREIFNQVFDAREIDRLHFVSQTTDNSSQFRIRVQAYDANMNILPKVTEDMVEMTGAAYDPVNMDYRYGANTGRDNPIVIKKPVVYYRVIITCGNVNSNTVKSFSLIGEYRRKNTQFNERHRQQFLKYASSGTTALRPVEPQTGQQYYDTTLSKPIWWSGTAWKDAVGTTV